MRQPIAYAYEAALHCDRCAIARFPELMRERAGFDGPDIVDREGNPLGAVMSWDTEPGDACDDCGDSLN